MGNAFWQENSRRRIAKQISTLDYIHNHPYFPHKKEIK
jgi:hypothetical protein